jgi:hypothetical protein
MKKTYKLTDRNLIRNFGKIIVNLDEEVGNRLVKSGKAIISIASTEKIKSLRFPSQNKAVFYPPEEKTFSELGDSRDIKYPGPKDRLFPHIAK